MSTKQTANKEREKMNAILKLEKANEISQSAETELLLKEFVKIKEKMKKLAKMEEELKNEIKVIMQDEKVLTAGKITVALKDMTRQNLDKKLLLGMVGEEIVKECTTTTTYQTLTIIK